MPPEAIEAAADAPGGPQVIDRLSRALLEVAGLCLNEAARPVCSPRLMEAAVWAAARWADTYLFPEDALPAALEALFGASGSGPGVLEGLVRVATTCLVSYPGERELHAEVGSSNVGMYGTDGKPLYMPHVAFATTCIVMHDSAPDRHCLLRTWYKLTSERQASA